MKGEPLFLVLPFPFWASYSRNTREVSACRSWEREPQIHSPHLGTHTIRTRLSLHHHACRSTQGAPGHNHRARLKVTHFNVAPDYIGVLPKRLTVVKWAANPGPQDPRGRKHRCYGARKTSLKGDLRAGPGLRQQTGREGGEHSRSLGPQICSAQRAEEGSKIVLLSGAQAIGWHPFP